jgi:hypothetical protein
MRDRLLNGVLDCRLGRAVYSTASDDMSGGVMAFYIAYATIQSRKGRTIWQEI